MRGGGLTEPRLAEFFTRFTPPKTRGKWTSRLKCNGTPSAPSPRRWAAAEAPRRTAYYYRVNYFCLTVLYFVIVFVRNPSAFFAVASAR